MKKKNFTPLLLILLLLSLLTNSILIYQKIENNKVTRVVDGDSFELKDGRRIRLLGIDAPELNRCLGKEAKERLTELILGKRVRLKDRVSDAYGRTLANVIIDKFYNDKTEDLMVNRAMVREGLARNEHIKSPYSSTLEETETLAKTEKRGIYSEKCLTNPPGPNCLIKGNVRNNVSTYHLPNCPNYKETVIDTAYGDKWFCSEKEAGAAGFAKAKGCK